MEQERLVIREFILSGSQKVVLRCTDCCCAQFWHPKDGVPSYLPPPPVHATDVHMAFEKVHQLQDWIRKRGERYACFKQVCSIALESSKWSMHTHLLKLAKEGMPGLCLEIHCTM